MRKVDALKKVFVAFGYGTAVSDYEGKNTVAVLKEFAVNAECAPSVDDIHATTTAGVLNFIVNNKGSEEHEPYDLVASASHVSLTIKKGTKTLQPASDILYNGNKLKITATADEGYDLTTLTVNGQTIASGDTYVVNGHNVTIVATATIKSFDLSVDDTDCTVAVTKGGEAVTPGENALEYGDEITISASVEEGYELTELKVNGQDFASGNSLTVNADVAIVATGTAQG